jgi:hypothetical protein
MFSGLVDLQWWGHAPVAPALTRVMLVGVAVFQQRPRSRRAELEFSWGCSTSTHRQMPAQGQDRVARAQSGGVRQLEEFSLHLRRHEP